MAIVTAERALWLGHQIFPHEWTLRAWLNRRPLAGLEADDVIQETYAILASMPSVEHINNPRNYMFQVAKSVILQALRKSKVVTLDSLSEAVEGLQLPSDDPDPETAAADRQELGRVAKLIAALPPRCREAFVLRKVHGLSQREVANRLGLSESTVEKHIGKALGILTAAAGRGGIRRSEASSDREPKSDPLSRVLEDRRRY